MAVCCHVASRRSSGPPSSCSALKSEQYDPTLEAFVSASLKPAGSSVRVTPLNGDPAITSLVELPAGHTVVSAVSGSGRTFALTTSADAPAGSHTLSWWDSRTGAFGGSHEIAPMGDGMRVSSNGRLLAFWDLASYGARIVDTAAPTQLRSLGLGACRSASQVEASADGRWFVFADCLDNLRVSDLSLGGKLESRGIGVKRQGALSFAADTPEIVWVDGQGVVNSYDLLAVSRSELLRLSASEREGFEPWYTRLHLDRSADLLAVITGRGTLRLQSLSQPALASELPRLPVTAAALDLTALPDSLGGDVGWSSYDFSGTLELVGAGEEEALGGALPPPSLRGQAVALDPVTSEERYYLTFATEDREATTFRGHLDDLVGGTSYRVVVERVAAAELP